MAQSIILNGAQVKVYLAGNLFKEAKSIQWAIDYGEEAYFGVDSPYAQEIALGKVTVSGTITAYYVQASGGLQGKDYRTTINQITFNPYISLRVQDRKNSQDIFFCPQVKVTQESVSITAKGTVQVTLSFRGIVPYNPLDLQ